MLEPSGTIPNNAHVFPPVSETNSIRGNERGGRAIAFNGRNLPLSQLDGKRVGPRIGSHARRFCGTKAKSTAFKHQLSTLEFDYSRREPFYPFGAREGLLLDRIAPDWRKRYFAEPFS